MAETATPAATEIRAQLPQVDRGRAQPALKEVAAFERADAMHKRHGFDPTKRRAADEIFSIARDRAVSALGLQDQVDALGRDVTGGNNTAKQEWQQIFGREFPQRAREITAQEATQAREAAEAMVANGSLFPIAQISRLRSLNGAELHLAINNLLSNPQVPLSQALQADTGFLELWTLPTRGLSEEARTLIAQDWLAQVQYAAVRHVIAERGISGMVDNSRQENIGFNLNGTRYWMNTRTGEFSEVTSGNISPVDSGSIPAEIADVHSTASAEIIPVNIVAQTGLQLGDLATALQSHNISETSDALERALVGYMQGLSPTERRAFALQMVLFATQAPTAADAATRQAEYLAPIIGVSPEMRAAVEQLPAEEINLLAEVLGVGQNAFIIGRRFQTQGFTPDTIHRFSARVTALVGQAAMERSQVEQAYNELSVETALQQALTTVAQMNDAGVRGLAQSFGYGNISLSEVAQRLVAEGFTAQEQVLADIVHVSDVSEVTRLVKQVRVEKRLGQVVASGISLSDIATVLHLENPASVTINDVTAALMTRGIKMSAFLTAPVDHGAQVLYDTLFPVVDLTDAFARLGFAQDNGAAIIAAVNARRVVGQPSKEYHSLQELRSALEKSGTLSSIYTALRGESLSRQSEIIHNLTTTAKTLDQAIQRTGLDLNVVQQELTRYGITESVAVLAGKIRDPKILQRIVSLQNVREVVIEIEKHAKPEQANLRSVIFTKMVLPRMIGSGFAANTVEATVMTEIVNQAQLYNLPIDATRDVVAQIYGLFTANHLQSSLINKVKTVTEQSQTYVPAENLIVAIDDELLEKKPITTPLDAIRRAGLANGGDAALLQELVRELILGDRDTITTFGNLLLDRINPSVPTDGNPTQPTQRQKLEAYKVFYLSLRGKARGAQITELKKRLYTKKERINRQNEFERITKLVSAAQQRATQERGDLQRYLNYYEILDINSSASSDDIKKAFRKLSRICHPDQSAYSVTAYIQATRIYKIINDANEVLSDTVRRAAYRPPQPY